MSAERGQIVAPGGVIGILGGGQLGRMSAMAAAKLGYRVHVYCPEDAAPAAAVAWRHTRAAYDDRAALAAFAAGVDVITFEFENIPAAAAEFLAALKPMRPKPAILHVTQERLREKNFLKDIGVMTTAFRAVATENDLPAALAAIGTPAILKAASFGYDGKGQARIDREADMEAAWRAVGETTAILEAFVPFDLEISVVTARGLDGAQASFVPVENRHRHHILDETLVPAPISRIAAAAAGYVAERIALALALVGLLAVEMFVMRDGRLLVNELAPRPHNSGHWSLEACLVSQFEQHIRAVCGLPLGAPRRHSNAVMKNLIGDEAADWRRLLADPAVSLHLYGKREARPGRKMGHYTRLLPMSRKERQP